jgi:polyphosphate kinase 2 (PPK2 family)
MLITRSPTLATSRAGWCAKSGRHHPSARRSAVIRKASRSPRPRVCAARPSNACRASYGHGVWRRRARGEAAQMIGKTKREGHQAERKAAPAASVDGHQPVTMARKPYEKELLRLQAELVKVQEWVRTRAPGLCGLRGRDAAGSGSTIKRVTQSSTPALRGSLRFRAYRTAAVAVFPALYRAHARRGRDGSFDRSWYNCAGVERVMGFCTKEVHTLPSSMPHLRALAGRGRHPAAEVLVFVSDAEQENRASRPRPDAAVEALTDGFGVDQQGRTTRGPRTRCSCTPTSLRRRGMWSTARDKRAARINMIAHLPSTLPYHEGAAAASFFRRVHCRRAHERPPREMRKDLRA